MKRRNWMELLAVLAISGSLAVMGALGDWRETLGQADKARRAGRHEEAERLYRATIDLIEQMRPGGPPLAAVLNNAGAECQILARISWTGVTTSFTGARWRLGRARRITTGWGGRW